MITYEFSIVIIIIVTIATIDKNENISLAKLNTQYIYI